MVAAAAYLGRCDSAVRSREGQAVNCEHARVEGRDDD